MRVVCLGVTLLKGLPSFGSSLSFVRNIALQYFLEHLNGNPQISPSPILQGQIMMMLHLFSQSVFKIVSHVGVLSPLLLNHFSSFGKIAKGSSYPSTLQIPLPGFLFAA